MQYIKADVGLKKRKFGKIRVTVNETQKRKEKKRHA